jgi:hypothetical protein
MDNVFVVLYNNYGDQGVDFCGVFKTRELAEKYIINREPNADERRWFDIYEEEIQDK